MSAHNRSKQINCAHSRILVKKVNVRTGLWVCRYGILLILIIGILKSSLTYIEIGLGGAFYFYL